MRDTGAIRVISKMFFMPREKKIRLDEIGSWVWRRCDGRTDVEAMINQMSEEFKLSRKESEVSLFSFLRSMSKKKLIGFEIKDR